MQRPSFPPLKNITTHYSLALRKQGRMPRPSYLCKQRVQSDKSHVASLTHAARNLRVRESAGLELLEVLGVQLTQLLGLQPHL